MNRLEKWHYVEEIRGRYHTSDNKVKKLILDEFCAVSGYHSKYAIRLLHKGSVIVKKKRGPKRQYPPELVLEPQSASGETDHNQGVIKYHVNNN